MTITIGPNNPTNRCCPGCGHLMLFLGMQERYKCLNCGHEELEKRPTPEVCECSHDSERHADDGTCFGRVYLNSMGKPDFEGDEYQCKCKRYKAKVKP